jgi:hypothetical protein
VSSQSTVESDKKAFSNVIVVCGTSEPPAPGRWTGLPIRFAPLPLSTRGYKGRGEKVPWSDGLSPDDVEGNFSKMRRREEMGE